MNSPDRLRSIQSPSYYQELHDSVGPAKRSWFVSIAVAIIAVVGCALAIYLAVTGKQSIPALSNNLTDSHSHCHYLCSS